MRRTALVAITALCLPGCALVTSPFTALGGHPYGATRADLECIGESGRLGRVLRVPALIDLPFALAMDTAFLPVALIAATPSLIERDYTESYYDSPLNEPAPEYVGCEVVEEPSEESPTDPCEAAYPGDPVTDRGLERVSGEGPSWALRALHSSALHAHPLLRDLTHAGTLIDFVPWETGDRRVDVLVAGAHGTRLVHLQRWDTEQQARDTAWLTTVPCEGTFVSAIVWNPDGSRIDLLNTPHEEK